MELIAIPYGDEATDGAHEYDLSRSLFIYELANEFLRQFQRGKNIGLEHTSEQLHRYFGDGAAFGNGSIIDQDIDIPFQRVLYVVVVQEIKFLDSKVLQAERLDLTA